MVQGARTKAQNEKKMKCVHIEDGQTREMVSCWRTKVEILLVNRVLSGCKRLKIQKEGTTLDV